MEEKKVRYVSLDEITPYKNNPRNNEGAVDAVAASIREFGFKVPIIIDAAGVIVAGHTRYEAAQRLGLEEVPVIDADDLTTEQVQAFRLVDNKTQELSKWDYEKLDEELFRVNEIEIPAQDSESLDSALEDLPDIDMSQFGFMLPDADEGIRQQDIDDGEELSLEDFEDQNFECECPMCGFRFNEKGGD